MEEAKITKEEIRMACLKMAMEILINKDQSNISEDSIMELAIKLEAYINK